MLTPRSTPNFRRGQWSLIGSLVAIAIIIILAAVYLPRLIRPVGTSTQDATAIQRANGVACMVYQSQIKDAVQMYKTDHDGQAPQTLDELKNSKYGVTDDVLHAPGCSFQLGPDGAVTDVGHGQAPPQNTAPPMPGQPTAPQQPTNGTRGPGGVTIPNIPGAGGTSAGGDTGE
jgi:flagellin-like protein